jgi:hypothetical protein
LARATQDAFASGMRVAVLLGAVLLGAMALYTFMRGPGRAEERADDLLDLESVEGDSSLSGRLLAPVPADG